MSYRIATAADIDRVVETLTSAFFSDPLWGPVFPDETRRADQAGALWRLYAVGGLRHDWLLVTGGAEAVSVWHPPGEDELSAQQEAVLPDLLVDVAGRAVAEEILELFELFEAARPVEPHFYLSLLGTHDDHRGKGLGMDLLREGLRRIDERAAPAYLESTNPANDKRYSSVGFVPVGGFTAPSGHVVTTMWREAG